MFKHITALAGKLRYLAPVCLLICWLLPAPVQAEQDYLDEWKWRNPMPQGNTLTSVAYGGNGIFVSVGYYGTILTSTDGVRWTRHSSGTSERLYGITYGGGNFVAVGEQGTILTSPNGTNWTGQTSGTTSLLFGITHGNSGFVAVGHLGTILTSANGETWTSQTSGTNVRLEGVTYAAGTYLAVGGTGTILTSTNGMTWTSRTSGTTTTLQGVTYGNGSFVAVGGTWGASTILTSVDGETWTNETSGTTFWLRSVTYANGSFAAVGGGGILTSPDGVSWTSQITGPHMSVSHVTHGNSRFVAVGFEGNVVTSTNGADWISHSSGTTLWLEGITYGNGIYVAVGESGVILTSLNGVSWTRQSPATTTRPENITYGKGIFVAVGGLGTIQTSANGVKWTSRNSGTTTTLWDVAYGNGQYVAVGSDGTILTSANGVRWTSRTSTTTERLEGVTYGNGIFVVVGYDTILTSTDAVNWTPVNYTIQTPGAARRLRGVTYGNGKFVIVGDKAHASEIPTILISTDGVTWIWTKEISDPGGDLYAITYGNGSFVAVGDKGTIMTSADGENWTSRTSGTGRRLKSVAYGNGSFIVVGDYGTILQNSIEAFELQVGRSASINLANAGIISMRRPPGGLSFDAATSTLSGIPLRPGTYRVQITTLDDVGNGVNSIMSLVIEPLPPHAAGNFQANMGGELIPGIPPGGSLAFRITPTGVATGQLRLADATYRWRGNIAVSGVDDATIALAINRRGQTPLLLELELANDHTLQGKVVEGAVETPVVGWRQVWHRRSNPPLPAHVGRINTLLELSGAPWVDDSAVPQGLGYAMLTSNISGGVRWLGQLADGTRLTGSTTLGPDGQLALWSSLLRNTGSILIEAGLDETAALQGAATWTRLPQANPRQRNYRNGFDAISLTLGGGRWTPPARNESVLDLPLTDPNAALTIASGGIALSATDVAQTLLTIDSRNRVTPAANDANISVRMVPKTGLVRIRFQLNDDNPENPGRNLRRTVNATAILVPGLDDNIIGGGFVLLPQLADPPTTTSRTSPILSGRIVLRKSDG